MPRYIYLKLGLLLSLCLALLPLPVQAARFLALSPHACEMLFAIDAGAQVVGGVSYCDYPQAAKALPQVGSYRGIDVEAALSLKPDIAVVLNRQVAGAEMLETMGVKLVVSNPTSFADIFRDLRLLGDLSGKQKQAEALVGSLQQRLVRIQHAAKSHAAVFYEIWPDPLLTAGGSSFINDLITTAGGRNVFADVPLESPKVNVESVLAARPTLIVIPLEKRDVEARKQFWRHWFGEQPLKFVAIDSNLLHRPGPRLLDGLELLHQALIKDE